MKKTILRIFCFIFVLCTGLFAQQVITAEKAIEIGLEKNYDIRIARNNYEIAKNNKGLGSASFMPKLDISANKQYSTSATKTNSPFSFGDSDSDNLDAAVSLNWTLFDGFSMFITNSRYRELERLGQDNARNIIENTTVAILRTYFNYVRQLQLLEVNQNSMQISETRLEKEKVRRELGSTSSTDFLNAQVAYNNDRAAFLEQQLQVFIAQKDLNIALGYDPLMEIKVEKDIIIPPNNLLLHELMQQAINKNSALLASKKNKSVAEKTVSLSKSGFYPRLGLTGSYSLGDRTITSQSRGTITTETEDKFIGLNLSYNLFNGFRDKINYQNARISLKNSNIALEKSQQELKGKVREKYDTFNKQLELVLLEETNIQAAQQNLQVQMDRYNIGSATYLELRDAQINLIRAQSKLIASRYQARITRLELDQLTGTLQVW